MSVSGEGAAPRSARKWLLLLCPENWTEVGERNRLRFSR